MLEDPSGCLQRTHRERWETATELDRVVMKWTRPCADRLQ